ncbi:MAG: glutaredoxin domain-containing protein [Halanaerobiales bacterium]
MTNSSTNNFLKIVFIIFLLFIYFIINTVTFNCQENQQDMQEQPIYIAIFSEPGCHDCEKAKKLLEEIVFQYPQIEIRDFDISTPEGVTLAEQLGEFYQVSEYDRLLVPLIYIGDKHFLREQIKYENIINYIEEKEGKEFLPPWERVEEDQSSVQDRLVDRFQSFGIGAIAISGLIDGINPCAFATIIFFISYLTLINRKGKELLWVGGMFTLAVFLTYFLIGTGALKIVTSLSILPIVRKIFVYVMAAVSAILAFISLSDYLKFKKTGQPCEATLQLPERMKKMIHSTIRKNVKTRNFIIMAAATGFLVSILELACTGQIYLPTLIFISNVPELRTNALLYLLVYNLMFVIPLIMVFLFTYWGTSSQQWTEFSKKNFGRMKLLMTFIFFGLAILLVATGLIF